MITKELRWNEDIGAQLRQDCKPPVTIHHDLTNWSSTCSYFRNLLAPEVFKNIKLANNEKSGSSLHIVAKSQHNVHVKELRFIGSVLSDAYREPAASFSDTERIFPPCVDGLMSELRRFPNLERLCLNFDYQSKAINDYSWVTRNFTQKETPEQVLKAEALVPWRALVSRTYSALARNKPPHFQHLEIRNLIWKEVSTYKHAAFHDFLSHVEQFTFTIPVKKGRSGSKLLSLMEEVDEYFFNHLTNVTILSIKDIEIGQLLLHGKIHSPLALQVDEMPLLTTLHLDFIFISSKLSAFLVGHKDTIEELVLRNCYAFTEDRTGFHNSIYWSQLFNSLFSACPAQLHRLELVCTSVELFFSLQSLEEEGYESAFSTLLQDPRKILFPYAEMNDAWRLFHNWQECFAVYLKGEDQRSWDRLAGLVEENAKKAGKSKSKAVKVADSVLGWRENTIA